MMKLDTVGASIFRVDAPGKVTGRTLYPQDLTMEGMVWGATLRSSEPHARILGLDTGEAEAMPGVLLILTQKDVPGFRKHGVLWKDHDVFCHDKVRRIGDPIAFVVAESRHQAEAARDRIRVDYEPLPGLFDPRTAMADHENLVHEGQENLLYQFDLKRGDVDKAFAEAAHIARNTYELGSVDHMFLQPEAGIAWMDGETVCIALSTQYPHFDIEEIAASLDLPKERIRYLNPAIGGAFGGREDVSMQIHLALAALKLDRPVKAVLDRDESFHAHSKRHAISMEYETACDSDGRLTAMRGRFYGDTGAYASWANNVMRKCGVHAAGPYHIPNLDIESYAVYTNNPYAGAMRGFGATQPPVGYEQQMDHLAQLTGLDPAEIRRRNMFQAGSLTATGQDLLDTVPLDRCLDAVTDYFEKHPMKASMDPAIKKGRGIALAFYGTGYGNGYPDVSTAQIEFLDSGRFHLFVSAAECGQGSDTALRQIAAEALGCSMADLDATTCDTDYTTDSGTAAASRQTYNTGNAIRKAGAAMNRRLLEEAARCLELNSEVGLIVTHEGVRLSFDPRRQLSFEELAQSMLNRRAKDGNQTGSAAPDGAAAVPAPSRRSPVVSPLPTENHGRAVLLRTDAGFTAQTTMMDENGQGSPYWPYTFGACGVEVEVDITTGNVRLTDAISAQDVGRAINPHLVEGQMEGGFAMALGYALMEDLALNKGRIKNDSFTGYIIPTSMDMPDLKKVIIENPEATGPYGAKGIGEPVMTYVTPAIFNAIHDAAGIRIRHLPASPDVILKALAENETSST